MSFVPVEGLIEVQNLGERRPFISVIDPSPIFVKYITFQARKPYTYLLNCPTANEDSDEITVPFVTFVEEFTNVTEGKP